jgi:hypothetical protein
LRRKPHEYTDDPRRREQAQPHLPTALKGRQQQRHADDEDARREQSPDKFGLGGEFALRQVNVARQVGVANQVQLAHFEQPQHQPGTGQQKENFRGFLDVRMPPQKARRLHVGRQQKGQARHEDVKGPAGVLAQQPQEGVFAPPQHEGDNLTDNQANTQPDEHRTGQQQPAVSEEKAFDFGPGKSSEEVEKGIHRAAGSMGGGARYSAIGVPGAFSVRGLARSDRL